MPRAAKSAGDDDIEPYYTAKVTLDSPDAIDGSAAPVPALPCTFESIAPSLLTGVLGYIYGTGRKSISMLFNKKGPRGIGVVNREGMSSAKTFAVMSFSYSVPLCMLKRLRDKEDWKNHSVAGAFSGFLIAWGNSPVNMLGSAVLLAAVSGYLARAEHVVTTGPAHAAQLHPPSQPASRTPSQRLPQERSMRRRGRRGQPPTPPAAPCANITDACSTCPHSSGLLEQTAHYISVSGPVLARYPNVALAATAVWEAVRPGCRSCQVPKPGCARQAVLGDPHSDFL